jgi:hypothetical protein
MVREQLVTVSGHRPIIIDVAKFAGVSKSTVACVGERPKHFRFSAGSRCCSRPMRSAIPAMRCEKPARQIGAQALAWFLDGNADANRGKRAYLLCTLIEQRSPANVCGVFACYASSTEIR